MAIYRFGSSFTFANVPRGVGAAAVAGGTETKPAINPYAPGTSQLSDVESGRVANTWEKGRVEPYDVEEFLEPGFRYLDGAMKKYWSDIRVPSKDSYRFIRTKVAGMRASLQIWSEDLRHGRVQLPVISISRGDITYNPDKFTPPYGALRKRFVNKARTRVALQYRPVPYIVNYTLSIWAEHKRDAEYILHQILVRFNQLAELRVSDEHGVGNVQMKLTNSSDVSDKEASAEQHARVKYEVTYNAEAWLSIPEKTAPTIVGRVLTLKEDTVRPGFSETSLLIPKDY